MAYKIQLRRGLKQDLPALDNGEVGYAQDTEELFIGAADGNKKLTFDADKHAALESQLAETVHINLNHPKYGINGDGTDEIEKIRQAFEDAMSLGKPIDLGKALTKYTISESIVIDRPLTIYANGENSVFEQLSWGVPCLEIRSSDVSIVGRFKTEINTTRVVFDSTAMAASKNNALVKAETTSAPREAGSAIYCFGNFDRLKIDVLDAKGYIVGLNFIGDTSNLPENINIGTVIAESVDFGVLGGGFRNLKIDSIQAKNILRSQGVDEHALYLVQKAVRSVGLYVGSVLCNGIETPASHIVSIKSVDNYHIGFIEGENAGAFFNAIYSKGYVGSIQGTSNVGENLGTTIAIQEAGTECTIDNVDITSEAKWIDSSNRGWGIAITGGASASINNPKIKMTSATPSSAFYFSGAGEIKINNPSVVYVTPLAAVYAFSVANNALNVLVNNPTLSGHNMLFQKIAGANSKLIVNPNLNLLDVNNSIVSTDGIENTFFTEFMKTPFQNTANSDTTPVIRSHNVIKFVRTISNSITQFRFGSNGQEIICINGDNLTGFTHGSNIVLKDGASVNGTQWKVKKFVYYDGVSYEV